MKKKAILGVAGVLSLVMGTTVFASDFSTGYMGRMPLHNFRACSYVDVSRNYMRPASGICLADRCDFGNCNFIDGNWVGSCGNYVDEDQNGVCDNYTGQGSGAGSGAGYGGGSGAANNYTEPVYTEPVYNEPVYTEPVYNEPVYNDTEVMAEAIMGADMDAAVSQWYRVKEGAAAVMAAALFAVL